MVGDIVGALPTSARGELVQSAKDVQICWAVSEPAQRWEEAARRRGWGINIAVKATAQGAAALLLHSARY